MLWGIWDTDDNDWVREMPSKVDDGGVAILAFTNLKAAEMRAAQHYGYESFGYKAVLKDGHCEVRRLGDGSRTKS